MNNKPSFKQVLTSDIAVIFYFALFKLLLHFAFNGRYGYFRDELYYAACGEHLDWGFVDHAPMIAFFARVTRALMGDSLFALRFFPAVAGALKVLLTGLITRALGGRRFAQSLACLSVLVAPIYLGIDNFLSMNAFEPVFWMGCAYIVILILNGRSEKLWLLFGLLAGLGLMNKHSMLFFGFGLVAGLLLTRARRLMLSKWFWLGGLIAFVVFLPNLIWEINRDWPTLELLRNVANSNKNVVLSPVGFLSQQALIMHPFVFPIWVAGLYYYLFTKMGRSYRALGVAYVITLVLFIVFKGKHYYLAPIYPMLLAPGAIFIQSVAEKPRLRWMKPTVVALLIIGGLVTAPFALPVLPIETYIKYAAVLPLAEGVKTENNRQGKVQQQYADMFGWENQAATVARVFDRLSPEEKSKCAIFGQNYGEAAAIDFFGPRFGLPKAISGHQSYFLWGPRDYTGEIMIVIGDNQKKLDTLFEHVEQGETIHCEYCMPYEDELPVWLCRGLKMPMSELWPSVKVWR